MKLLNYILAFLLIAAVGYIVYQYFNPEKEYVDRPGPTQIRYRNTPAGQAVGTVDTKTVEQIKKVVANDSLKTNWSDVINGETAKVVELTRIKAALETELMQVKNENSQLKDNVTVWQNKYYKFVADNNTGTGKLTGDFEVKIAATKPKKNKNTVQVSAMFTDPDLKINGMEVYRQDYPIPRSFAELVLEVSGGKVIRESAYNARLKAELLIMPDRHLSPFVYGQYQTNDVFNKPAAEVGAGVKAKIKF